MESKVSVAVNDKGHAVVTYSMPLSDYCMQRARSLRALVQVVSGTRGTDEGATPVNAALIRPLMELIRTHVDELEPLFEALDQRSYEKGFEDGQDLGLPKVKSHLALSKGPAGDGAVFRPVR